MTNEARIAKILVVDDNDDQRVLAGAQLAAAGYAVVSAESGAQALAAFAEHAPDMVLLDVMMPGMDGFETCRRLRAMRGGTDVAILFLTALTDLGSHQQALESGADDFLTKPLNRTELLIRIRSLLWVRRLKEELRHGYELIRGQRDALLLAQRQREELTSMLVHDLKNPLTGILANVEFLSEGELPPSLREAARDIRDAAVSMRDMLMNLLDISRSEDGALIPQWASVDLALLLEQVGQEEGRPLRDRRLRLDVSVSPGLPIAQADRDLVRRLLENLIDNAARHAPAGTAVRIEVQARGDDIEIRVRDEGPGVPPDQRERIFEKYVRLESGAEAGTRMNRGLGLTFCRLAVEVHGGRIWVEDNSPRGAAFCLRLPVKR